MRPRDLPKVRDQVVRHLDDQDSLIRRQFGEENQAGLTAASGHLKVAGLYWAAPDMAALAVAAGATLGPVSWSLDERPSACGLMVFDGGIGMIRGGAGQAVPVDACTWGAHPDGGLVVALWMRRSRLGDVSPLFDLLPPSVVAEAPPLMPAIVNQVRIGDSESWEDSVHPESLTCLRTLAAAWLLMQQPVLVERATERPDRPVRARYAREQRPDPEVTVVDLRRAYVPQDRDPDAGTDGRRYKHRWVVSGHWRNQAFGKDRAERRQQWIPAHEKGPDGAPLLITEKVNVWRR
jgi:hypothetical protein